MTNTTAEEQSFTMQLSLQPRLIDLFALRGEPAVAPVIGITQNSEQARTYKRVADDGVIHSAAIHCDNGLVNDLSWSFTLQPGATQQLCVDVLIESSDYSPGSFPALPSRTDWAAGFRSVAGSDSAVDQAIDDLRTLLLSTEYGPYPAAGIPIFVNFFGRDALITGMMILKWQPTVLKSVLAFLAAHQGRSIDPFREEEPGKILHEVRRGELSRTNKIPFGRYYGSVDATPLFLMAAGEYFRTVEDDDFARELRPAIEAATDWLTLHLDGPSGLATFEASGSGLTVQSWKDSGNSMVDEHGHSARQPLAVAEVQGYAYAALQAAALLLADRAEALKARANSLQQAFHAQFWLPELATYAMALDAGMKPLRVLSSDPGHLLWAGIVPKNIAPILVTTLLSDALWSGWGLRTLGSGEVAFNPVSYHNGSVWPHDTGLFAMGLARYGFEGELQQVARALLDLATASPGKHIPELISGFDRSDHREPVPYTHANAPQAWAAAAVVRMADYLQNGEVRSSHSVSKS
jgi:glycogen debranching enzyme